MLGSWAAQKKKSGLVPCPWSARRTSCSYGSQLCMACIKILGHCVPSGRPPGTCKGSKKSSLRQQIDGQICDIRSRHGARAGTQIVGTQQQLSRFSVLTAVWGGACRIGLFSCCVCACRCRPRSVGLRTMPRRLATRSQELLHAPAPSAPSAPRQFQLRSRSSMEPSSKARRMTT